MYYLTTNFQLYWKIVMVFGLDFFLSSILFVLGLILAFKSLRMMSFRENSPFVLSIFSICLALLFNMIHHILYVRRLFTNYSDSYFYIAFTQEFQSMKQLFMFISLNFDLYKWCLFVLSTGSKVQENNDILKARHQYLKIITMIVQTLITAYFLALSIINVNLSEINY